MTKRKTPCDVCGNELIEVKIDYTANNEVRYTEICVNCGNLLYGSIKKVI